MENSQQSQKTILVVDDEEIIRSLSRELLDFLGYRCFTAENEPEAEELVRKEKPDLVLLDFHLPTTTGEAILEKLKQISPRLKVAISSGRELDDEEKERISTKGAIGFISKPFTLTELQQRIQELLS